MSRPNMKPLLLSAGMLAALALLAADGKKPGCVPVPVSIECAGPSDCEGMAHAACEGAWTCTDEALCEWVCATPPACVVGPACGDSWGFAAPPAPSQCGEGATCQCIPSCPFCDDCPAAACAPAPGAWLCPKDGSPCGGGATCQCVPSCPDCADCKLFACVPPDLCGPIDCPFWAPPAPGWCEGGVVLGGGKDAKGCQLPPKCVKECGAAKQVHGDLVAAGKACVAGAECTQQVPVGLLCQCPAVLTASADAAGIVALQGWYLDHCAPPDGWGCGGGCPDVPLGKCTMGVCGY
ncbi:MAG: hypothetical protein AMXMBFR64_34110 [Myxococcales bacterium]